MTTIGPVGEVDLAALATLFTELVDTQTDHEAMLGCFRRMEASPDYILLGAKQDGRLVGFMMGIVCQDIVGPCQPFMVVENVVVSQTARRQGVARALWAELEGEARRRRCHYCLLVTGDWREEAHRFYTSVGFAADKYKGFKKYLD